MLAIWSTGHVQVFKLAAFIPLITAVGNSEGGGGVEGEVQGIQRVSEVPAAACTVCVMTGLLSETAINYQISWPG